MRLQYKILFFCLFNFLISNLNSQVAAVRDGQGNILNLHQMKITPVVDEINFEGLDPNVNRLKYAQVKGSPFLFDEWISAALFMDQKMQATVPARYNLATKQIHFYKNDKEFVITNQEIDKVVFNKQEDTIVFIKHPELVLKKKSLNDFVQVMNRGKIQLLKYTERAIGEGDSLFGTRKRYFFKDDVYYFIKSGDKVEAIKKLDKENILVFIPSSGSHSEWMKSNHINFRKEEHVINFLNYYNSKNYKP